VTYRIAFRPRADRDLRALSRDLRERVAAEVRALAQDPRSPDTKALQGPLRGLRRARVGDYRIAYEVDETAGVVTVHAIARRQHFYQEMIRRL
jgi:mRNA interferase RelE/StbE